MSQRQINDLLHTEQQTSFLKTATKTFQLKFDGLDSLLLQPIKNIEFHINDKFVYKKEKRKKKG